MRQFIIIFVVVFILIWGLGLFFGFMKGVKYFTPLQPAAQAPSASEQLEDQKRFVDETRQSKERMMRDIQFQTQDMQRTLRPLSPGMP